jgi:AcrR family transcriptional regulator
MTPTTPLPYADLWLDVEPEAARQMLLAAVDAFATRGYSATTTREIAQRTGMSPAAVYVHYSSKVELLYAVCLAGGRSVLETVEQALGQVTGAPDRLRAFVAAFVAWHARNHTLARVIQYEARALEPEQFDAVDALQRRCERLLRAELRRGVAGGEFEIDDQGSAATAILSLGIDVARWYHPKAPAPAKLGARYADLAERMVASRQLQRA